MVRALCLLVLLGSRLVAGSSAEPPDGKLVPPRDYAGSLEERAQEGDEVGSGSKAASDKPSIDTKAIYGARRAAKE